MTPQQEQFKGLHWNPTVFTLEPQWTIEPDLESIKQTIQDLRPSQTIHVSFLAQGAFNNLYDVRVGDENLVIRVTLPVDPWWKIQSEVATVEWVQRNTSLSVPKIPAHQENRESKIGFEWILMTKLPGKPLADVWKSVHYAAKEQLVHRLAIYSSDLFQKQMLGIGNIYPESNLQSEPSSDNNFSNVDRIVSMQFFLGDHISQKVPRGPFGSSKDWMSARLMFNENDFISTLAKYADMDNVDSDGEANVDDAERTLWIIKRLKPHISDFFPVNCKDPEPSMLLHNDLSFHNILVSDDGALTGVVDWECVSALPLWKACDFPSFLKGPPRDKEPDQNRYKHDPNGERSDLYWEHLMHFELTKLRLFFINEMQKLETKWVEVFESSRVQRDFDFAAQNCDDEFLAKEINKWIDSIASGKENMTSLTT